MSDIFSNDIFAGLFDKPKKGKPFDPKSLSDSKKIELQHRMIVELAQRVVKLEEDNVKLKKNNNKAMPKIAEIDNRLKAIEKKRQQEEEERVDLL